MPQRDLPKNLDEFARFTLSESWANSKSVEDYLREIGCTVTLLYALYPQAYHAKADLCLEPDPAALVRRPAEAWSAHASPKCGRPFADRPPVPNVLAPVSILAN